MTIRPHTRIIKTWFVLLTGGSLLIGLLCYGIISQAQQPSGDRAERSQRQSKEAESKGLAEPFKGITTDGTLVPGLFPLRSTGVSTEPVRQAADTFLASLTPEQRANTMFPVDDSEWRKWMNQDFYVRQGVSFHEMTEGSARGRHRVAARRAQRQGVAADARHHAAEPHLGELNHNDFERYSEWFYWITVMGTPSATEPWGWQLDGHHAIINYFVLGDQVVMTPTFFGSEPVRAHAGKYKGPPCSRTSRTRDWR